MANKLITLRRKISSGFDVLHPETKKANIQSSPGTALTGFGASVLESEVLIGGVNGYGTVYNGANKPLDSDTYGYSSAADIREVFQIAEDGHQHPNYFANIDVETWDSGTTYSYGELVQRSGSTYRYINSTAGGIADPATDVNQLGVGTYWGLVDVSVFNLNQVLATKVALDGSGDIVDTQFPEFSVQGMRIQGTFGANPEVNGVTFVDNAEDLFGTLIDYNTRNDKVGYYKVAAENANSSTTIGLAKTYDDGTYNWTIRGHEDGEAVSGLNTVVLEVGDWIVYDGFETDTFYFSIVNNQYRDTSAVYKGLGQITTATDVASFQTTRTGNTPEERLVDEKAFRDSTKEIRELTFFDNPRGVLNYYADTLTTLQGMSGTSDNELAIVGTGSTKDIYQKISGTWTDTGDDATFPASTAEISVAGGTTLYDNDNTTYMLTAAFGNGVVFITTDAEPLDDDLVFYIE